MKRIELEKLVNTRDLSHISNNKIKSKRIIRSGRLFDASKNDLETLVKEYNLKHIIDLRTYKEVEKHPDPSLDTVVYNHIPIFESFKDGITREEKKQKTKEQEVLPFISKIDGIKETMEEMYPDMLKDPNAIASIKRIFDLLLETKDGSILYHCSAGKDRVGTVTFLILGALGFDKETIIKDFLKTNDFYEEEITSKMEMAKQLGIKEEIVSQIPYALGVDIDYINKSFDYIEKNYGSILNYLKEVINLSDEKIKELRGNYLE